MPSNTMMAKTQRRGRDSVTQLYLLNIAWLQRPEWEPEPPAGVALKIKMQTGLALPWAAQGPQVGIFT